MATRPQEDPELVEVFETPQESEAMVVHGLLESAGIESAVITGEAQDVLAGVGGMIIRVSPEDADEARNIIKEFRNTSTDDEEDDEDDLGNEG
jgi:Putative prokaryotic signal transducing protein